jgi:hypothetical protein
MLEPAIGKSTKVTVDITHTEWKRLARAADRIRGHTRGWHASAIAHRLLHAPAELTRFVFAAAYLAKFIKEKIIDD